MRLLKLSRQHTRIALAGTAVALVMLQAPLHALASTLVKISADPYMNPTSAHATQVEPDTFARGATIVSAFQSGRFNNGGASNIGWATSRNNGASWHHGFLPGTTVYATPAGPYARATDAAVTYNAKDRVWLIVSLMLNNSAVGVAVLVSRSTTGGLTWSNPVTVAAAQGSQNFDKTWIVCDNHPSSPFFGNCYVEFDDFGAGDLEHMATSTDGGLTWGAIKNTGNNSSGIGGQPLVQPNGTVIVPLDDGFESVVQAFKSTNGGNTWSSTVTITSIQSHLAAGGSFRAPPLPSAEIDATGRVYVVWADCRFEPNCAANDIVLTSSTDGTTWSPVRRIPIDARGSGVDHNLPGLAVDPTTSGSTTHLGLTYYYFPNTNCTSSTCQLDVGYVQSTNQSASWTTPVQVAGPMALTWLPLTTQGYMTGDYISTSFAGGKAYPVIANANPNNGTVLDEAMYAPVGGLDSADGATPMVAEAPATQSSDVANQSPVLAR